VKDLFDKYRDTALIICVLAFLVGAAMKGGSMLVEVAKWPFIIALIMGLGFMVGNDGGHAAKRWIRDVAWPWVRDVAWPRLRQLLKR